MAQKNPIWDYFEKSETDTSKAVCKLCHKAFSLGSQMPKKQTTFGLKQHLSILHNAEYDLVLKRKLEYDEQKNETKKVKSKIQLGSAAASVSNVVQLTIPQLSQKTAKWAEDHEITRRIDKAIMDLIIVDMLPYSIVEGDAFKRLNFADPNASHRYNLKSEKYFRTSLMPKTYERVKSQVKSFIDKCDWISATTDIWTNKSCSLLSLTAHFIVESKRLKVILGAIPLENDHTGTYIDEKLTEMITEWNLEKKLFLILRDNAANMVRATRDHYVTLGCVAHTLQLVIKELCSVRNP